MHRFVSYVRRPVKRQGAEQNLLIMLLSFAASVTLTRLFLEITGYPQLGGGGIHIAHVLWGGLLQFIAVLLPLIIANRWAYQASAFLAGSGIGLFIDEVGKFITATNDYFYPLAAPIIYAFFLLTVLLYVRVRRPPSRGPRAELYRAFDAMEEILEHDLDPEERAELVERLRYISQQTDQPTFSRLADHLLEFVSSESLELTDRRMSFWNTFSTNWKTFENRWLNQNRLRIILIGGLLAMGLVGMSNMLLALPFGFSTNSLERLILRLIEAGQIGSSGGLNWFLARIVLETSVSILLLASAALLAAGKDEWGVSFGYLSLLLSLTTINLLVFYFDQFSAIITAIIQLALLLGIAYFRQRYRFADPGFPNNQEVNKPYSSNDSHHRDGSQSGNGN